MNDTCCKTQNPSHIDELARLNRAIGQLEGIKKMIENERYCVDIITQLRAVQSATKSIETNILQRHLESCVQNVLQNDNTDEREKKIAELIQLFKKLD